MITVVFCPRCEYQVEGDAIKKAVAKMLNEPCPSCNKLGLDSYQKKE